MKYWRINITVFYNFHQIIDINSVTYFVRNQSNLFSQRLGTNSSSTMCTGRLIMRSPTLYLMVGLSPKHQYANADMWASSRSNRSDDRTNVIFNFSPNILIMLKRYFSQWSMHPEGISMGHKMNSPYYCMSNKFLNINSLPHYPPSLMHLIWTNNMERVVVGTCKNSA